MIGLIVSALLLVSSALLLSGSDLDPISSALLESLLWLSLTATAHFSIRRLVWRGFVPRLTGLGVPRVLEQLSGGALMLLAACVIMVRVLELPVASVVTTSSVFIAIVGFALRNMISDLFTGIALGIEQPFSLGDWVQIQDGTVGQVVEMNWRSTRLLTREEISVVVPNSELAVSTFKNYSKPSRAWRDEFDILLSQSVTAHQAERVLLSAVQQVPEIVKVGKPAEVRIVEYCNSGILWQVRYWVPDYPAMSALRYEVQKSVLRNMHYAGLAIPAAQVRVLDEEAATQDGSFAFLRGIDLFQGLAEEELRQLQQSMQQRLARADTAIVRQGDSGASLFIVKEGLLEVSLESEDQDPVSVAHLLPGSFFGEMSLLTGDARHATVTAQVDSLVFEVTKEDLEPILHGRPQIAQLLSETIADRHRSNRYQSMQQTQAESMSSSSLLARIRSFFAITGFDEAQVQNRRH